ncbi:ZN668 protein, partial [Prunella himalayana]|nr:ZN668 protein [Prunella himalayana]
KHLRGHAGLRPHRCHACPKAYAERKDLRNHLRAHTGEGAHLGTPGHSWDTPEGTHR